MKQKWCQQQINLKSEVVQEDSEAWMKNCQFDRYQSFYNLYVASIPKNWVDNVQHIFFLSLCHINYVVF